MEKKRLNVGADPFPPYQYFDDRGELRGLDYERVLAVFCEADYDINVVIDDWTVIQDNLDQGKLDAAFQVQPTTERLQRYHFSDILREAATEVVTARTDLQISSYSQIETLGLKLGVISGYTNGPDIDALDDNLKHSYPNPAELLLAVSRNEVDLAVYDRGVKEYLMEQNGLTNIVAIPAMTFLRPLHVIFMNENLRDEFDEAMARLNADVK